MGLHSNSMPTLQALAAALGGEVSNNQVLAPGPAHSAIDRSLAVKLDGNAPDGFIVHSFANDDPITCRDHVRQQTGLGAFKPNGGGRKSMSSDALIERVMQVAGGALDKPSKLGRLSATHDYTDADSALLYQVLRYVDPKDFRQRRPDGNGGFIWSLGEARRVLYRWPELLKYPDATVFVTEGEKDADRVASLGHCATTVAAGKWTADCVKALNGRDVIVLEDNDDAGRAKALAAAQALHGTAKTVRIVALPGLPDKGDVSDWLDADPRRAEKLVDVCFDVAEWQPGAVAPAPTPSPTSPAKSLPPATKRLLLSSADFIRDFVPPDYLLDSILQRRFLYSLTGKTGSGKTAVALLLTACVGLGRPVGPHEVAQGKVIYFAGENPDDVRMRWIALAQQMDFEPETIEVYFIPGTFQISELAPRISEEVAALGGAALIIVDTSAAYFEGDDENMNTQAIEHAKRLRGLVDMIPGGPTILVLCHPVKNAGDDNLIPRGGGGFVNEMDGNATCRNDDLSVEVHWQGKFRGPDFAPISFILRTVTHERLKTTTGKLIPTVVAAHLSDIAQEDIKKASRVNQNKLLAAIAARPDASLAELAVACDWKMRDGKPYKMMVKRALDTLKKYKLAKDGLDGPELTDAGRAALKKQAKEGQKA